MGKRVLEATPGEKGIERPSKRCRPCRTDRLSMLSDELLLRTLSFLPLAELLLCERLSRRLRTLATDGQVWKALYYDRFVRPRASRIPGIRVHKDSAESLRYSSKVSKWLSDERLVRDGTSTNWKQQYKLRHNWSRGSARVTETEVANEPSTPPLLVRLHERWILIADEKYGLRAWDMSVKDRDVLHHDLRSPSGNRPRGPISMAIDTETSESESVKVVIGFGDGSFSIYTLEAKDRTIVHRYSHPASSTGSLSAVAYSAPYLVTMNQEPRLSLYVFDYDPDTDTRSVVPSPRLLSSLQSHSAYPPLSLALRTSLSGITASIAYAIPQYLSKWLVGLQELRLAPDGTLRHSRVATAATQQRLNRSGWLNDEDGLLNTVPVQSGRPPSSLSYNHPYLLTAHPNNTLTLYVVNSTEDTLTITPGTILWGHTSAVSGAHVGDRGKAVSVSSKGDELRVWELEGRGLPNNTRKSRPSGHGSVQVRPAAKGGENISGNWDLAGKIDGISKGWIAFDEEKVVLLREKMHGAQAVVVYDFT